MSAPRTGVVFVPWLSPVICGLTGELPAQARPFTAIYSVVGVLVVLTTVLASRGQKR